MRSCSATTSGEESMEMGPGRTTPGEERQKMKSCSAATSQEVPVEVRPWWEHVW